MCFNQWTGPSIVPIVARVDLRSSFPQQPVPATDPGFSVVIACEDSGTAAPACEVLELVEQNLKDQERLIYRWWNFEVLAIASLRELASREAATADMIIVAARAESELPVAVAQWMKQWLNLRKTPAGVLVAVVDSGRQSSEAAQEIMSRLKTTAALARMDFFATEAKTRKRGAGVLRRDREAARQFVMACTNRSALRIAGPRAASCVPGSAKSAC